MTEDECVRPKLLQHFSQNISRYERIERRSRLPVPGKINGIDLEARFREAVRHNVHDIAGGIETMSHKNAPAQSTRRPVMQIRGWWVGIEGSALAIPGKPRIGDS